MFKRVLSKYLLVWLVFVCVLAFYWPTLFGAEAFNPFFIKDPDSRKNLMSGMIAATMLAVGSLLPYDEVKAVAKRWHKTLPGATIRYISTPLSAFCVAKAPRLPALRWRDAFRRDGVERPDADRAATSAIPSA